jgi:hypothetical protein
MATYIGDFANQFQGDASIRPQAAYVSTTNGTGIDMQLSDGPITLLVTIGVTDFSSGDETYTFKLQESDTSGGTYTDISGVPSVAWTAVGGDVQNTTKLVLTKLRSKRWVRAVATLGGTTPSCLGTAVIVGMKKILGTSPGNQL